MPRPYTLKGTRNNKTSVVITTPSGKILFTKKNSQKRDFQKNWLISGLLQEGNTMSLNSLERQEVEKCLKNNKDMSDGKMAMLNRLLLAKFE